MFTLLTTIETSTDLAADYFIGVTSHKLAHAVNQTSLKLCNIGPVMENPSVSCWLPHKDTTTQKVFPCHYGLRFKNILSISARHCVWPILLSIYFSLAFNDYCETICMLQKIESLLCWNHFRKKYIFTLLIILYYWWTGGVLFLVIPDFPGSQYQTILHYNGVSNRRCLHCLLNCWFRRR